MAPGTWVGQDKTRQEVKGAPAHACTPTDIHSPRHCHIVAVSATCCLRHGSAEPHPPSLLTDIPLSLSCCCVVLSCSYCLGLGVGTRRRAPVPVPPTPRAAVPVSRAAVCGRVGLAPLPPTGAPSPCTVLLYFIIHSWQSLVLVPNRPAPGRYKVI